MSDQTTIAVLGTGIMGAPIAENLAKAGHDVRVWNRTQDKAEAVEGIDARESPAAAVEGADLVVTMLLDADAVAETMIDGGGLGALRDDAVWVQMSTVGIEGVERLSKLADERGVAYLDAPVLGTKQPAEQGELVVLVGGPDAAKRRAQPVFDAVGQKTVDVGEVGTAMRAKLMLNHWVLALVEATAETIALGESLGLDPQLYLDTIAGGPLDSKYAQMKGKTIIAREMPPAFPLAGALKDVGLILEAAERHGFDAALAQAVQRKMGQAVDAGHGGEDMAATYWASASE